MKRVCYFLFLLLGLLACYKNAHCENTLKVTPIQRVEYTNPLIERWIKTYLLRQKYGKAQWQTKATTGYGSQAVPDAEQTPPQTPFTERRRRAGQHHSTPRRTARVLALPLRQQNAGGSHRLSHKGAPYKKKVYKTLDRQVSRGVWL